MWAISGWEFTHLVACPLMLAMITDRKFSPHAGMFPLLQLIAQPAPIAHLKALASYRLCKLLSVQLLIQHGYVRQSIPAPFQPAPPWHGKRTGPSAVMCLCCRSGCENYSHARVTLSPEQKDTSCCERGDPVSRPQACPRPTEFRVTFSDRGGLLPFHWFYLQKLAHILHNQTHFTAMKYSGYLLICARCQCWWHIVKYYVCRLTCMSQKWHMLKAVLVSCQYSYSTRRPCTAKIP